jgi:PBP1b-binding outer membrane lipoprotein LpoB
MKITLIVPAAALLLAGCASTTPRGDAAASASAQEERYVPIGTYLPRKRGQTANNASTVDKTDLENMKNAGNGSGANEGLLR